MLWRKDIDDLRFRTAKAQIGKTASMYPGDGIRTGKSSRYIPDRMIFRVKRPKVQFPENAQYLPFIDQIAGRRLSPAQVEPLPGIRLPFSIRQESIPQKRYRPIADRS